MTSPKKSGRLRPARRKADGRVKRARASGKSDPGAEGALRERVKELTCLYAIAQLANSAATPLPRVLQGVVASLPSAWQRPEHAWARLMFDDTEYVSSGSRAAGRCQSAPIVVRGRRRGFLQVGYPDGTSFALLDEERRLLDEVARQIGVLVERAEARSEQDVLQMQLRHADRLATIGQFAAGVAHEINEPLGGILGFAHLISRTPGLPQQVRKDVSRIQSAALHAREIIRKLMTFARQAPPQPTAVDLNRIVRESASLWLLRCEDNGIRVDYDLAGDLPRVMADEAQIRQVVTNLAVNAAQAMLDGGRLTIATALREGSVELTVRDTGTGMSEGTRARIFDPFFTTKDVNEGTGLGLSVVHGIVQAHGGSIEIDSLVGRGTVVRVLLPLRRPSRGTGL